MWCWKTPSDSQVCLPSRSSEGDHVNKPLRKVDFKYWAAPFRAQYMVLQEFLKESSSKTQAVFIFLDTYVVIISFVRLLSGCWDFLRNVKSPRLKQCHGWEVYLTFTPYLGVRFTGVPSIETHLANNFDLWRSSLFNFIRQVHRCILQGKSGGKGDQFYCWEGI